MRRVRSVVLVAVLMQSCVCLQPVDENPQVDGGLDASVESPVTSFIAPVPIEDLAEREWIYWRSRPSKEGLPYWRRISWRDDGALLIDAVGGVVLRDAGYVSSATNEWRQSSHLSANVEVQWGQWNGDWYRYTYPSGSIGTLSGPMRLFKLNRDTEQLELQLRLNSVYDAGFGDLATVSAVPVWGGQRWWVFDRVWNASRYADGQLIVTTTPDAVQTTTPIDWRILLSADGVDGDTQLIWGRERTSVAGRETVVRFRGTEVTPTVIDADFCSAPYLRGSAPITMGCFSDGGLDLWTADKNGERIIGRDELPPNLPPLPYASFLVQLQPLRELYQHEADAGVFMLGVCDSNNCVELMQTYSAPLNAGVDDAGALYVADYILDAGVRVTRFTPGAW